MVKKLFSSLLVILVSLVPALNANAQDDQTFRNFQFSCTRVSQAWAKYNESLRDMFEKKGVAYPPQGYLHPLFQISE